jgi:hypothetical protein
MGWFPAQGTSLVQQPLRLSQPKPGTRQGTRGSPRRSRQLLDGGCITPRMAARARGVLGGALGKVGEGGAYLSGCSMLGWWNRMTRRRSPRDPGWSCGSTRGGRGWGASQIERGSVEGALNERGQTAVWRLQIRRAPWRTPARERSNGTRGWWRRRRRLGSGGFLREQRRKVEEPPRQREKWGE